MTKCYEKIVVGRFLKTLNEDEIISVEYPDPPDALIKMKGSKSIWVKVRSVYRHKDIAKHLNSTSSNIELHSESLGTEEKYRETLIVGIVEGIKDKDRKSAYQEFTSNYGRGVLILYVDDPFCTG